ncbi:carboxymuconolactone decarboxylase family protein [Streptomyces sp. Je 1-369]|uniref:carboxymuconolactone decarboxylase family protein n=1 Tax=Streptomyces sp. Je 1-369 TaxID=2966192 RepID=UPI002285A411|nr:carboxymuconolactone decarboxylase family protein [Streptomyces sp. Je 1-369]WAL96598.1 carboxymuconolactone decarboxylase family protein [Streptomyces sp. Je 1-369]
MQARMQNPAMIVPEAMKALLSLSQVSRKQGLSQATIELVQLRVSQINGSSVCVDGNARSAVAAGATDLQCSSVAAWRILPCFTPAERSAFALAEAATRLADRPDPVPAAVWDEAARHFTERELAALVLAIGVANMLNRINIIARRFAGSQPWEC